MDAIRTGERRARRRRRWRAVVFSLAMMSLAAELVLRLSSAREREATASRWRSDPVRAAQLERSALRELADPVLLYGSTASPAQGVALPKPSGGWRVLVLGGSLVFGRSEPSPARLLEELARESERTVQVVDLSLPGYRLEQAARALEAEGLGLEPDLVLVCFGPEEIDREELFFDPERRTLRRDLLPLPLFLRRPLWRLSHLYGWIAAAHARAAGADSGDLDPRVPTSPLAPANQHAARAALVRMDALCRERGSAFFAAGVFPVAGRAAELAGWFSALRGELGLAGASLSVEPGSADAELARQLHEELARAGLWR